MVNNKVYSFIACLFAIAWFVGSSTAVIYMNFGWFGACGCLGVIAGAAFFAWDPEVDFVAHFDSALAERNVHIGPSSDIEKRLARNENQLRLNGYIQIAALVLTILATLQWGFGAFLDKATG